MDASERERLRENADIWIDDPLEPALVSRDQVLDLLDALDAAEQRAEAAEARAARLRGALDEIASVALECRDAMEEPASKGVEWRMRSQITEAAMGFNQIANSASAALAATEPSERAADGEAQFRDGELLSRIEEELPSTMCIDGRLTEPDPEHPGAWRFKNEETS